MNKLQELIQKLCPNGVEYKKLEDIGDFFGGLTGKSKEDFKDGNSKFITYRNVYANPSLNIDFEDKVKISDNEKQHIVIYGDILFTGSSETPDECGMSSVVTTQTSEKLYLNSFCFGLRLYKMEEFNLHYLKHILRSNDIREQIKKTASGVTRYNVSKKRFAKICIPVPPIEVQTEIAHILDSFTNLSAELQARKQQYEYYRNKLLTFDNICGEGYKRKRLGDVCNFKRGQTLTKKETTIGNIPVVAGGKEPAYYHNVANRDGQTIVVAGSGAYAGYVSYWKTPIFVSDAFTVSPLDNSLDVKYIFYFLKNIQEKIHTTKQGAGIPHVYGDLIARFEIPIPPIEEQKRIVKILDKFYALVSDLSQGLPAEIEAVQQQYEYYRNKLLSFPRQKQTV